MACHNQTDKIHWPNAGLMLDRRHRRWASIKHWATLGIVSAGNRVQTASASNWINVKTPDSADDLKNGRLLFLWKLPSKCVITRDLRDCESLDQRGGPVMRHWWSIAAKMAKIGPPPFQALRHAVLPPF